MLSEDEVSIRLDFRERVWQTHSDGPLTRMLADVRVSGSFSNEEG